MGRRMAHRWGLGRRGIWKCDEQGSRNGVGIGMDMGISYMVYDNDGNHEDQEGR